ncbi:MAG: hypothetical protein ACOX1S_11555 [Anaerostipes sp.]
MRQQLKEIMKNKKLLSLYINLDDTEKFLTGYINCISIKEIIINHITPTGNYDGYVYAKIHDIYRIETDTKYIQKIEKLMHLNLKKHHENIKIEDDILKSFLQFLKEKEWISSFQIGDDDYYSITGFVKDIGDTAVRIMQISDDGEEDGETIINTEVITSCQGDTMDEQIIKQLI